MKTVRFTDAIEVTETHLTVIVYALLAILSGVVAVNMGLFFIQEFTIALVGILFITAGLGMAWIAETITTTINANGNVVIKYARIIGHKSWVRKLDRSNIQKIDYIKSFDESSPSIGKWHYISSVYIDTNFDEQIEIGSRAGATWVLGRQIIKKSIPLDAEAGEIATLLNVPLNTIDARGVKNSIKNFYNPRDKMRFILQRPTQQQLDQERNGVVAKSVNNQSNE